MAEEYGEKTEAPTPRRREEAREQGQVARSVDLTAASVLLGFLLLMDLFGTPLVRSLRALTAAALSEQSLARLEAGGLAPEIRQALIPVGLAVAPLLGGAVLIAVLVNVAQVGLLLNGKRLQPNLGMLSPLRGLQRLVQPDNLIHTLMSALKMVLVGLVAWSAVRGRLDQIVAVQSLELMQAFGLGVSVIYSIGLRIAVLLLVLAIIDYGYQRYSHERKLRMTRQEVKDEMRRMEGDPKIKQRRRQIAIQMAMRRLGKDVPTADVIVTNPTEYAVALKYDAATMSAPKVVAKGQGHMALRIRQIAVEHGVPIVERKPLAQALYRLVQVGQEIPEQFYAAVAEILAYVYELTGKARRSEV